MGSAPYIMLDALRIRAADERKRATERAASARAAVIEIVSSRLPPEGRAWLVGSLAWGDFGTRSDIDLVFEGVDPAQLVDIETAVVRRLDVPVDVLSLSELPETFRARVHREGIAIHGSRT